MGSVYQYSILLSSVSTGTQCNYRKLRGVVFQFYGWHRLVVRLGEDIWLHLILECVMSSKSSVALLVVCALRHAATSDNTRGLDTVPAKLVCA